MTPCDACPLPANLEFSFKVLSDFKQEIDTEVARPINDIQTSETSATERAVKFEISHELQQQIGKILVMKCAHLSRDCDKLFATYLVLGDALRKTMQIE